MINETFKGFFKPTLGGLRYGDPLSLYLFILIEEILSQFFKREYRDGRIGNFFLPRGCP